MCMSQKIILPAALAFLCSAFSSTLALQAAESDGVQIKEFPQTLRIEIGGKLFSEYHFKESNRPYFYPVLGPDELPMTRNFPMRTDAPNETHDHTHHRSLWYAHGDVNGVDFWSDSSKAGKIVHQKFTKIESGSDAGMFVEVNNWVAPDGHVVCTDTRTIRIYNRPQNERLFDFDITLQAPADHEAIFGDTKEGTMACRLAPTLRLKGDVGEGHIVQSTGVKDGKTWGKRAAWCDYYGPVQGKTVGIAIFDHPGNPRHPTWWHVRDYGLYAANPFGVHDFEKKAPHTGDLSIPAGKSVTFRYRWYMHEGDTQQADVADHYQDYSAQK